MKSYRNGPCALARTPVQGRPPFRTLQRTLLPIQQFESLGESSRRALLALDEALLQPRSTLLKPIDRVAKNEAARLACIGDTLSNAAVGANGRPPYVPGQADLELSVCASLHQQVLESLSAGPPFMHQLVAVAKQCGVASPQLRRGTVSLDPDGSGIVVKFPDTALVYERIRNLQTIVHYAQGPGCYRALLVLVALLNGHALTDGNGRVARVIANIVLRDCYGDAEAFLPFYVLRRHAPFALELGIRSVELHGEWERISSLSLRLLNVFSPSHDGEN